MRLITDEPGRRHVALAFCLGLACGVWVGRASASGIVRWEATYTVRWGGLAEHVAARVDPQAIGADRWLVAQEVCLLNGLPSSSHRLRAGDKLRVPVYRRRDSAPYAVHPYRRWHRAVRSGLDYQASPRLLYAIASHENPWADENACGCVGYSGLRDEFAACARTCRHFIGEASLSPTLDALHDLGEHYAADPTWPEQVWEHYGQLKP